MQNQSLFNYRKITPATIERLRSLVGEGNVVTGQFDLENYSRDEMPAKMQFVPEAAVKAETAQQIAEILKLAGQENFPVTPRGRGTGLSGGCLPVCGGIVLSLEKMEKVLELDRRNLMAVVEPGIINAELQRTVEEEGLFYPPDPASLESCSIGGNLAENSGGPRAVKYGVTRNFVCGLEAVLANGEIIHYGGKMVKNVAGYDLAHLLIGSEGTFAVITQAILKLLPLPFYKIDLLIPFISLTQAAEMVSRIIGEKRIIPTAVEFMEKDAIKACEIYLKRELPFSDFPAQLLIELDGEDLPELQKQMEKIGELALQMGAPDILVADNPAQQRRLWEARRSLLDTMKSISSEMEIADISVPRWMIPEMVKRIKQKSEKAGICSICFGHAGDGNLHIHFLKRELDDQTWQAKSRPLLVEVIRDVLELGGSVSGEHGIGITKKPYLKMAMSESELKLMRTLKQTLDPRMILNPGKVLDF